MSNTAKKWLFAAVVLVLVGAVIVCGAFAAIGFDFSKLSTYRFATSIYELDDDFDNILINTKNAEIAFFPSDDGLCRVECFEEEKTKHSVKAEENTLLIDISDSREWYDYIGIGFGTPTVKIYLPKDTYTSLSVTTVTGDIELPDSFGFEEVSITGKTSKISCFANVSESAELYTTTGDIILSSDETETITLSATTGDITVIDTACNSLDAKNRTGETRLENVIAKKSITAENSTGGIYFESCDAAEITVETSTGDVEGTLLSGKTFVTDTRTGDVNVPRSVEGGKCKITTTTGDIEIEIKR